MINIGRNEILFGALSTEVSILSSKIDRINIFLKDSNLLLEIDLRILYNENEFLKLIFSGIREYSFYHNSDYLFYNVEEYKFLRSNGLYYLSFDPEVNSMTEISENDGDFVLFENIEGYLY